MKANYCKPNKISKKINQGAACCINILRAVIANSCRNPVCNVSLHRCNISQVPFYWNTWVTSNIYYSMQSWNVFIRTVKTKSPTINTRAPACTEYTVNNNNNKRNNNNNNNNPCLLGELLHFFRIKFVLWRMLLEYIHLRNSSMSQINLKKYFNTLSVNVLQTKLV